VSDKPVIGHVTPAPGVETPSERNWRIGRAAGHTVGVAANQRDAAIRERDAAIAERDRLRAALEVVREAVLAADYSDTLGCFKVSIDSMSRIDRAIGKALAP
jgi:hypothetical protein